MGKVVMYGSVSVDGFVADENDQPGPLFEWLSSGDVPLDESGVVKVSQTSYDYTRAYWDQIGVTIVGRHVFDMTDGWDGRPPGGIDHVVVVTHRPEPEGWDPEAPFHFVDGVEAAVARAHELAGDRIVEVAAGDVGGQVLAAGLVDEVRMDVVPVVLGAGKRYFGSAQAQHLLEDPDVVIRATGCFTCATGCAVDLSAFVGTTPCVVGRVRLRPTGAPRARHVRLARLEPRPHAWDRSCVPITSELVAHLAEREPIFHGPAWPRTRAELERLVSDDFWEVGASGAVYTREQVLASVSGSVDEMDGSWRVDDLECRELADGAIAVTYVLRQRDRVTRRLTIWCRHDGLWRVAYHQGTMVQAE